MYYSPSSSPPPNRDVYDCETHELHEVSQSRRKHARAFAQSVYADIQSGLRSERGMPLQAEVHAYLKGRPLEKAHVLSDKFTWRDFFAPLSTLSTGGRAGGGDMTPIDLDSFITVVLPLYHDGLYFHDEDARRLMGGRVFGATEEKDMVRK